jgi:hypothetical protein
MTMEQAGLGSSRDNPSRYHGRLVVGSRVIARVRTAVCDVGELGLVYEVYARGLEEGYSILFASGRHDGFTVSEIDRMILLTGELEPTMIGYQFHTVLQLMRDFDAGRFRFSIP